MRSGPVATLVVLLITSAAAVTQDRRDERGLIGLVLSMDDTPIAGATVLLRSNDRRVAATSDQQGRFRLRADASGRYEVVAFASAYTPFRIHVTVPASRTLNLPPIRLHPVTYFRARFVTAGGEPILTPRLRLLSHDGSGGAVFTLPEQPVTQDIATDGTVTVGPLPSGVTVFGLDTPPFAQTRLAEIRVAGGETLIDGGVVTVEPGAMLHVDLVDASGAPVADHIVFLEDARPFSPLLLPPQRTDSRGRVSFDRLAAGQYRIRTVSVARCFNQTLSIGRLVSVSGSGALRTRIIVGGTAKLRVMSPYGPFSSASIALVPESGAQPAPLIRDLRDITSRRITGPIAYETACSGITDAEGRVTLPNVPPGAARVNVRLPNSTHVRRVAIPVESTEVQVAVPDRVVAVRVTDAQTSRPLAGAALTWTGGGARVESRSVASGDALLEGVDAGGGTLEVAASGYRTSEERLREPPGAVHEVALTPLPESMVRVRVVMKNGDPIANAVVQLLPHNILAAGHIAATDEKGMVTFQGAAEGDHRVSAFAAGFEPLHVGVTEQNRTDVVLALSSSRR